MRAERRVPTVFNLSMLDVMACGLGAMLLLFIGMVIQIRAVQDEAERMTRSDDVNEVTDLETALQKGRAKTNELERELAELRNRRERAKAYVLSLSNEADRLSDERDLLRGLVSKRGHSSGSGREIEEVLGSRLGIFHGDRNQKGRLFVEDYQLGSWLPQAILDAGLDPNLRTKGDGFDIELVAVGDYRPANAEEILDIVRHQDPTRPADLTVRQRGKEVRLRVPLMPTSLTQDDPLPLPGGVRHLWILVQPDQIENVHLAALVSDVLRWYTTIQSVTVLRIGSQPRILSPRDDEGTVLRSEMPGFLRRLAQLLRDDSDAPADPLAGLERMIAPGRTDRGSQALFLLTQAPVQAEETLRRCIDLAKGARITVSGMALRTHRSAGLGEFLALLAQQTGGGFLGVGP